MQERPGFLKQLRAIRYLTRQGIALQGHNEMEGKSLAAYVRVEP